MCRCYENKILPKSFQTKPVLKSEKGYRLTREYNREMLRTTMNEAKLQYHRYLRNIRETNDHLKATLTEEDYNTITRITEGSRENKYKKESMRLKEKFESLRERKESRRQRESKLKHEVYDLTKDGIDEDVKSYLKLGPDFSETPNTLPFEKIIIETERMCKIIEEEKAKKPEQEPELEREAHRLREEVKHLLRKQKKRKIKSNLTHQESIGKTKANKDRDKVYLPADKGKVMVAMDRTIEKGGENSYEFKMKKVLDDMKARPSIRANEDWDLTEKISREGREIVKKMVEDNEITEEYGKRLKPNNCRAPRLTGYPKIHKTEVPLRGVVSFIGSPYEKISKALVPILRSLQGRSGHYIKNGRQLKEIIKEWTVQRDEILVSYDVEQLYPSIPISKALDLVECLLKCKANLQEVTQFSVKSIMKLLNWIFKLTYCEYNGKHYVLDCGPIGLSVVGEIAIIYMEEFQMKAKSESYPELNSWPWYVDDSILKCKVPRSSKILDHLNSIEPEYIKFTMEEEVDNKLAVMDLGLNVNRKKKRVEFNVYYKKTNTNIMIKKKSNHTEKTKRGVIKGYVERAKAYCDPEYLKDEMDNIFNVFEDNGYSRREIEEAMRDQQNKGNDPMDKSERGVVVIPNIQGFSQQYSKIARKHGFKMANNTERRVRDLVAKARTPLGDKMAGIVYNIPCYCENHAYTGETDRMWGTRQSEHKDKVRLTLQDIENGLVESAQKRMNAGDGGLAKHASVCSAGINWEGARIVGREAKWTQRKYLEGIETLKLKNKGINPLNSYNRMEQWQSVVYSFHKLESDVR